MLGQEAVAGKSNEIIDAQAEVARTLLERQRPSPGAQGDPARHLQGCGDVLRQSVGHPRHMGDRQRRARADRGPMPCGVVAWLFSDRRYLGEVAFP
jgi:hypothetical protein